MDEIINEILILLLSLFFEGKILGNIGEVFFNKLNTLLDVDLATNGKTADASGRRTNKAGDLLAFFFPEGSENS